MLFFILGSFFGSLVMFCARLADKDITRIVDRYNKTGSVIKRQPIIIPPPTNEKTPEELMEEMLKV